MDACTDERLKPTFAQWHTKVSEAYAAAKDDNDRSYFELVKPPSQLAAPERKRMVKTILSNMAYALGESDIRKVRTKEYYRRIMCLKDHKTLGVQQWLLTEPMKTGSNS